MTWQQRWYPLRAEWALVATHRQDRPCYTEPVAHAVPRLVRFDEPWQMPFPCLRALHRAPTDGYISTTQDKSAGAGRS